MTGLAMGGGQLALSTQEVLCGASPREMWAPTHARAWKTSRLPQSPAGGDELLLG